MKHIVRKVKSSLDEELPNRYAAAYEVGPVSAIAYIAPVKSIEPWQDSEKFVVNLSEPARKIGQIRLVEKSRVEALQNLCYTTSERLESTKTLDEVWEEYSRIWCAAMDCGP